MSSADSLKTIWFFFRPYKLQVLILFILSLVVGVLEAANVAAIFPILSTVFTPQGTQEGWVLSLLRSIANLLPIENSFLAFSTVLLIMALLAFITRLIAISYRVWFAARLAEKSQLEIFRKFMEADYQYFIDHKQGELIYNVASAPHLLSTVITSVTEIMSQMILSLSILVLLFSLSWAGTLVVVAVGLAYYYLTRYLGGKVSYTSGRGELQALQEANVILNEAISGIKQVKAFSVVGEWQNRFGETMRRRWHYFIRRDIWRQLPTSLLMLMLYFAIGAIAISVKIVTRGDVLQLVPVFGTFAFAVFRLFPIIGTVGVFTMQIMGVLPTCEALYAIFRDELTHIRDGKKELRSFTSAIHLDQVTFTYKGRTSILEDVSITFAKGETTAMVGRSGSGKTTVISLILRLFVPDKGAVRVDGVDLAEYRLSSWLKKIGYVSQDTFIFNDTVRNNITFRSGELSDEEVVRAAKYADAHSFIIELPQGYDTVVGDRGLRLSSGQGQRIAVARAMIRQPEILIFDEATNALDSISEAAVQRAIDEISRDHTVIVVAHRLSTIANADKIVVLGEGRVLEQGTHEQLLKGRGAYWELFRSQ